MRATVVAAIDQPGTEPRSTENLPARVEISEEAARDVHADALLLKRSDFLQSFALAAGSSAATILGFRYLPARDRTLAIFALLGAGRFILLSLQNGFEYRRLRRETPIGSLERERRHDAERVTHRARMARLRWPPQTTVLFLGIVIVTLIEFAAMSVRGVGPVLNAAALVKSGVSSGEYWRLFSAALLHVSVMHLLGNIAALGAMGHLIEVYDRPWRVPLVFLAAALAGNVASTFFLTATSLGASGGILGLAGYALVVAWRQSSGGSSWLLDQLVRLVGATLIMGVVGYFFIDNAGHIGGLVAGIALGLFAVPRQGASLAPERTKLLDTAGVIAAAVLVIAAVGTIVRLLTF